MPKKLFPRKTIKEKLFNVLFFIQHLHRLTRHYGRYRMLVNELGVPITSQQHAKIVERCYYAGKFDAIYQKDCKRNLLFTYCIQKEILQVLRSFCHCSYTYISNRIKFQFVHIEQKTTNCQSVTTTAPTALSSMICQKVQVFRAIIMVIGSELRHTWKFPKGTASANAR